MAKEVGGAGTKDTGQARRVASFLLAWHNAEENGGWDPTDLWSPIGSSITSQTKLNICNKSICGKKGHYGVTSTIITNIEGACNTNPTKSLRSNPSEHDASYVHTRDDLGTGV